MGIFLHSRSFRKKMHRKFIFLCISFPRPRQSPLQKGIRKYQQHSAKHRTKFLMLLVLMPIPEELNESLTRNQKIHPRQAHLKHRAMQAEFCSDLQIKVSLQFRSVYVKKLAPKEYFLRILPKQYHRICACIYIHVLRKTCIWKCKCIFLAMNQWLFMYVTLFIPAVFQATKREYSSSFFCSSFFSFPFWYFWGCVCSWIL